MLYDIAIVGLGPAGASLARLVDSKRWRVIAFDRRDPRFPERCAKPCGGLLSPDALRVLARFNLAIPEGVIASPQIFSVKTIDLDRHITRHYPRFYLNIDRQKFDLWLMSLIPESVTLCPGSVVTSVRRAGDIYEITCRTQGREDTISARYVVGADGARSVVARMLFGPRQESLLLALQEWTRCDGQNPFFSCIFYRRNPESYSWSLCKGGFFLFGGAYPLHGARRIFEGQKERLREYGIGPSAPARREACLVRRLHRLGDIRLGSGNALLIGEAAGFISPSSFEGISGALQSAYLLSRVLNAGKGRVLRQYGRTTRKLRVRYALKIVKAAVLCSPLLRFLIMKSGIRSIRIMGRS